jgi:hypothetical protein
MIHKPKILSYYIIAQIYEFIGNNIDIYLKLHILFNQVDEDIYCYSQK